MYYNLVQSLKRRLVLELRDSFQKHPVYRKIVPFIQNRFSFTERPQFGIVVKSSTANKVQWAPDNFIGTVQSHVMLAFVGQAVFPLEWVREDLLCLENNNGAMPTAPGVYYMEILSAPTHPGESGFFVLDPLLTVRDEAVLRFQSGLEDEIQLQQLPVANTLRLWENGHYLLIEGTDYEANGSQITLLQVHGADSRITADYRYAADSVGPIPFTWNTSDTKTLPGVVLAFGKRAEAGQKVAIVVYQDRVDTANAFGGKFEANFDLDVIARDNTQMEELADITIMYLWGEKKAVLGREGIEVLDVSMGGETEEVYDETGDSYFYQASLSVQLRADWELHVPLPLVLSRVTQITSTGDTDPTAASGIQAATSDMFFATNPVLTDRKNDFERIS